MIRSVTPTYYEKLSLLVLFQDKWCHSTHLKLNNRSDGYSVYHAAAVRVITKDTSGALTQPYQSLYQSSVSQHHTGLEAGDGPASPKYAEVKSPHKWKHTLTWFGLIALLNPKMSKQPNVDLCAGRWKHYLWAGRTFLGVWVAVRCCIKKKSGSVPLSIWKWGRRECHLLILYGTT